MENLCWPKTAKKSFILCIIESVWGGVGLRVKTQLSDIWLFNNKIAF
jgi:hypothetical protein